jgi:serine/threonine-protein kinase
MAQGRNPDPDPDPRPNADRTLFDPPEELTGPFGGSTPPPAAPHTGKGGTNGSADDQSTLAQPQGTSRRTGGMDDPPSGDMPSVTGLDFDSDGGMTGLQPGQVLFDRYIVERRIGEGGMGTVWLVRHREFGSERALKLIVSGIARDPQVRARFRREAQILDKLNHPNAVRVYDARMGHDIAFIEMEFVRGESLNQVLKAGVPMGLDFTVNILDQLCDVLQAANDEGIIHRDLKPPNMMLVDGKQPGRKVLKLLDFGIAKIRAAADDVKTQTGSFMGTPLYSSPEQIVGDGRVDARSDIYSVGLILYELLTGSRPFDGTINAIIYKHTMVPPPPFAETNPDVDVPPAVEAVVLSCLAKEPDQRPQSPRELAEMFHQALDHAGPGPGPGPIPPVPPPPTPVWRRAALLVGLGFIVALLVAPQLKLLLTFGGGSPEDITKGQQVPGPPGPPKKPPPIAPSEVAKQLDVWKNQGFVRPAGTEGEPGWPRTLVRRDDKTGMPFTRDPSGVYVPKGYDASGRAADGKPPRFLKRGGTTFIRITEGSFRMGMIKAGDAGLGQNGNVPGPDVKLSAFYMKETEVTNGEIEPYMNALGPDQCPGWWKAYKYLKQSSVLGVEAKDVPATFIPWSIAAEFAHLQGGKLPTDAQWEYAARSEGKDYRYVWGQGELPGQPGNFSTYTISEVQKYPSDKTEQDIYDLAGNVQEWCRDKFKLFEPGMPRVQDPQSPPPTIAEGDHLEMVVRGGSFVSAATSASTISRTGLKGSEVTNYLGFRMVIECPEGPPDPR